MNIIESIKIALESIKSNKLRSFLTMLGIIIGISSVITILALGEGGKNSITGEFEKFGATTVSVSVNQGKAQPTDYITLDDIKQVKEKVDTVKYASPSIQISGTASSDKVSKRASIRAGSPDLAYINNTEILYGRYFNEREYEEGMAVAVLDENSAIALFGYSDVVGESIKIGEGTIRNKVKIIGVEKGVGLSFGGRPDRERPAFLTIPATFIQNITTREININSISLMASSKDSLEAAGNGAVNVLELRHNNKGNEVYSASNMMNMLDQINNVLGIFTKFIGAVAAISLLVGGIGVMNIMLVSVTERTREIGIRKAIGATTTTIMTQFLIESLLLALIGGIIGLILGIVGATLIGNIAGITPSVSIGAVIGVIAFSSAVGIFFGIYPARKAAKLDPIEALRYE